MRTEGTGLRRTTPGSLPAWSVTDAIAFLGDGLCTIRPDRSRLRPLHPMGVQSGGPDWSPRRDENRPQPEGHVKWNTHQAWSPDGRYIASIRDEDLYVMRSDGRGVRRVIDAPQYDPDHPDRAWAALSAPSWQPLQR